jgi:hypothetical protein
MAAIAFAHTPQISALILLIAVAFGLVIYALLGRTRNRIERGIDVIKNSAELIAAISTLLLTIVTAGLVYVAWLQLTASENDERPWVGATVRSLTNEPTVSTGVYRLINVINSGKSPAFKVFIGTKTGALTRIPMRFRQKDASMTATKAGSNYFPEAV